MRLGRNLLLILVCLGLLTSLASAELIPPISDENPLLQLLPEEMVPAEEEEAQFFAIPPIEWTLRNPVFQIGEEEYPLDLEATLRLAPENDALNGECFLNLEGDTLFPTLFSIDAREFRFLREGASKGAVLSLENLGLYPAALPDLINSDWEYLRLSRDLETRKTLQRQMWEEMLDQIPFESVEEGTYSLEGREYAAEVSFCALREEDLSAIGQAFLQTQNPLYASAIDLQIAAFALLGEELATIPSSAVSISTVELTRYECAEENLDALEGRCVLSLLGEDLEIDFCCSLLEDGMQLEASLCSKVREHYVLEICRQYAEDGVSLDFRFADASDFSAYSSPCIEFVFHSTEGIPDMLGTRTFSRSMAMNLFSPETSEILGNVLEVSCSGTDALLSDIYHFDAQLEVKLSILEIAKPLSLRADISECVGAPLEVPSADAEWVELANIAALQDALDIRSLSLYAMDAQALIWNPSLREILQRLEESETNFPFVWEVDLETPSEGPVLVVPSEPLPEAPSEALPETSEEPLPATPSEVLPETSEEPLPDPDSVASPSKLLPDADPEASKPSSHHSPGHGKAAAEPLPEASSEPIPLPRKLGAYSLKSLSVDGPEGHILRADYEDADGQDLEIVAAPCEGEYYFLEPGGSSSALEDSSNLFLFSAGKESSVATYLHGEWEYSLTFSGALSQEEAFTVLEAFRAFLEEYSL